MNLPRRAARLARGLAEMGVAAFLATLVLARLWPIVSPRDAVSALAITVVAAATLAMGWAHWREGWADDR